MNTAVLCIITMLIMVHGGPVKRSESFTTLTDADFDAARSRSTPSDAEIESQFENMWKSGKFEGDMDIGFDASGVPIDVTKSGVALKDKRLLWYKARVPYVISRQFSYRERSEIAAAILEYQKHTCIKFVPRRSREYNYVKFFKGRHRECWSKVGRQGGAQKISIGSACAHKGIIMHEMMHALGFYHEQSRVDRDQYIQVLWKNIKPRQRHNFKKYDLSKTQLLDTNYDYNSIMHYGEYSFSNKWGAKTIRRLQGTGRLGQRERFSETDLIEINRLYKCP